MIKSSSYKSQTDGFNSANHWEWESGRVARRVAIDTAKNYNLEIIIENLHIYLFIYYPTLARAVNYKINLLANKYKKE